jgi:hypothetical protein
MIFAVNMDVPPSDEQPEPSDGILLAIVLGDGTTTIAKLLCKM